LRLALGDVCSKSVAKSDSGCGRVSRLDHRQEEYAELMPLSRVAWITTVLVALLTAALLLLSGYTGYAALSVAVAGSAAINLL
jgi:hypothetical protein